MHNFIREPFNSLSHFFGAGLGILGLIAMLVKVIEQEATSLTVTAVIIFGISMIMLYAASGIYHMVMTNENIIQILRRVDHSMIYLLIAGTYAPFCLITLKGTTGYTLFAIVSGLAISGVIFKMIWFNCPRWVSTALYIAMGWIIIFLFSPLQESLGLWGVLYLVLGGVFYTIGGVIYGLKPNISFIKRLGFHEIFHLFILLGTICHFICIYVYVL